MSGSERSPSDGYSDVSQSRKATQEATKRRPKTEGLPELVELQGHQAYCSECCVPLKIVVGQPEPRFILCSTCAVLYGWEGFE